MNKTALITGASGGIGYELAKIFASDNTNLVLVARNMEKLTEIKIEFERKYHVNVLVIAKDLSLQNAPEEIFSEISSKKIQIDYLINNAGFGGQGNFHERSLAEETNMINLNVQALVSLTHLFLPGMIERKYGKILNVASTAAFFPGPLMAIYFATKAFVNSFSQAIDEEVRQYGITVTSLCPGPVETSFAKVANIEKSLLFKSSVTAPKVAKIAYKAMMKGKLVKITDPKLRFLINWINPVTPQRILLKMTKKLVS